MRKLLFALFIACATVANAADLKWAMTTQKGESDFMDEVGYILYSDGSSVMSIVKKNNTAIEDVTKVTFAQLDPSGISNVMADKSVTVLSRAVDSVLRISGCKDGLTASVVSASGAVVAQFTTNSGKTEIDVSSLSTGIYVLVVGNTSIKFIKK